MPAGQVAAIQRLLDRAVLERDIAEIVRTWSDGLADALALTNAPDKTHALIERYHEENTVLTSHLVAFAFFETLRTATPKRPYSISSGGKGQPGTTGTLAALMPRLAR